MNKYWLIFCIIVFGAGSNFTHATDFTNHFWKWSNSYPENPVVANYGKLIQLTASYSNSNQASFAIYGIPINIQKDFVIKFTINFGSPCWGRPEGIAFNFWGLDIINCDSTQYYPSDTIAILRPNFDSIINPIFWNIGRKKFNELKNAITFGGKLGIYNYSSTFCSLRPALSVEFDTHLNFDTILNNCYSFGNSVLDNFSGSNNHVSVTALGIPSNKYASDGLIAGVPNINVNDNYQITISWSYSVKQLVIRIEDGQGNSSIHSTNIIDFPYLLSTLSPSYSNKLVFIGFTATSSTQENNLLRKPVASQIEFENQMSIPCYNQIIKDFQFNTFLGVD